MAPATWILLGLALFVAVLFAGAWVAIRRQRLRYRHLRLRDDDREWSE